MAWESRNQKLYFYQSRRIEGRVKKVYIGKGLAAGLADRMATEAELDRREEFSRLEASKAALAPLDRIMDELEKVAGVLIEATLLAAGYWRPNYAWRKRRNVRGNAPN